MALYRKCIVSEQFLKEAAEQTASLNTRISLERKMRQPFLDSQTGVAQNHTTLWQQYINRCPGENQGQLYSYPARRWKKRKRAFFPTEVRMARAGDIETGEAGYKSWWCLPVSQSLDMHQISAIENPAIRRGDDDDREDLKSENSKDKWYEEVENISEPPDVGEGVDYHSDISDYEEIIRKKKKKGGGRGRRKVDKESTPIDDKDKPYCCEACGARYKTRPGLAYHYTHFHNGMLDADESCAPSPPAHKPPEIILVFVIPLGMFIWYQNGDNYRKTHGVDAWWQPSHETRRLTLSVYLQIPRGLRRRVWPMLCLSVSTAEA
eukprot:XP_014767577.1 PREDICTED: zinc finger protein ubi-d4 A-like isoform X5 [Octopus bimaculoides]